MNILIATDKFKGSLRADEVCEAISSGIRDVNHHADVDCAPMADGGEGTCDILTSARDGQRRDCQVIDPLGRPLTTSYGVSANGRTAFIEMASASGLMLLKKSERDPLRTSTLGTGLMIRHALEGGAVEVVLGVGGSATNDGGMGMATALGFRFPDREGRWLQPSGASLTQISSIETDATSRIGDFDLTVLCDVKNPLFGSEGAAYVFAPQKGADLTAVRLLDDGLQNLARVVERQCGKKMNFEGAGAGGGIAAGAHVFFNGRVASGVHYVMEELRIEERIRNSDLVITGEGALDGQSLSGKVVSGVGEICRRYKKPFLVFCGKNELNVAQEKELGARGIFPLLREGIPEKFAIENAAALLRAEARRCFSKGAFTP